MNQFSEYCKSLFEAEGMSLYRFCSVHHLERSGIRRILSGERIPKDELFEAFIEALTITPDEKQKVRGLYEREKIGIQKYENRIFVKGLLEYIGEQQAFSWEIKNRIQSAELTDKSMRKLRNGLEVRIMIREILRSETDILYCNFPVEHPELLQVLQEEFIEECAAGKNFYHLFVAAKRADLLTDVNYNLRLMKNILPFAMQNRINYCPYYCYGNTSGTTQISPYPWFLLSSNFLLLVSADADSALLYSDKTAVRDYHAEVGKQLKKLKPLIFKTREIDNALGFYIQECVAGKTPLYSMEYYPCVIHAYTKEKFMEYLRTDIGNGEDLIKAVDGLAEFGTKCRPYDAFLMMEGLQHFVRTGELGPRYGTLLKPFNLETRREILHRFEILCSQGQYRLHILPEGFFHPCPVIGMELYEDQRITLMSFENMATFSSFGENTVYDAFRDYFESLLENPEIVGMDRTIKILRELQKELE